MDIDNITGSMGELFTDENGDVSSLAKALLIGGGSATVGGLLTKRRHKNGDKKESRMSHVGRVLRNAAVAGTLGAGGYLALDAGAGMLQEAGRDTAEGFSDSELAATQSPYANMADSVLYSPGAAGAAGLGALVAAKGGIKKDQLSASETLVNKLKANLKGGGKKGKNLSPAGKLIHGLNPDSAVHALNTELKAAPLGDVARFAKTHAGRKLLDEAGVIDPRALAKMDLDNFKNVGLARMGNLRKTLVDPLLGRTRGMRLRRGGLAGLAALVPAVAATVGHNLLDNET